MNNYDDERKVFSRSFGECLQNVRRSQKITQDSVAEAVGISITAISDYENGKKCPSLSNAKRIADFLGIPLDLLCNDNPTAQYVRDLERMPVVALLTVLKLFRFRVSIQENGEVLLTLPPQESVKKDEYSIDYIKQFFKEYERIQSFFYDMNDDLGMEMAETLLTKLQEKYCFLPKLPKYDFEKKAPAYGIPNEQS